MRPGPRTDSHVLLECTTTVWSTRTGMGSQVGGAPGHSVCGCELDRRRWPTLMLEGC